MNMNFGGNFDKMFKGAYNDSDIEWRRKEKQEKEEEEQLKRELVDTPTHPAKKSGNDLVKPYHVRIVGHYKAGAGPVLFHIFNNQLSMPLLLNKLPREYISTILAITGIRESVKEKLVSSINSDLLIQNSGKVIIIYRIDGEEPRVLLYPLQQ